MPIDIFDPFVYMGCLSFLLFGALGTFACVQIIMSFLGYKDKTRRHYTRKLWFHVLLSLFGFFESIYAVSLILNDGYSRWGIIVHTLALYVNVIFFALIINFWKMSLNDISPSAIYGVLMLGINGIVTLMAVIALLILDVEDFLESFFNAMFIAVNSLTLFIMSSSMLVYGHHMKNNLTDSTALLARETSTSVTTTVSKGSIFSVENANLKIKFKILARINKILTIVLVCYALRVVCLGYLLVIFLTGKDGSIFALALWLLFSWLIPSLPALVYLNIMKLSSNNSNSGTRAFKFQGDDVTESAMMDDERKSDDWDSVYERFSDTTADV